jgi:hypothetical protein
VPGALAAGVVGNKGAPGWMAMPSFFLGEQLRSASRAAAVKILEDIFIG